MEIRQTEVYVVLVNNKTIHTIATTEEIAKKIAATTRGTTVHRFPLISKYVDKAATTEAYDGYPRPYYEGNEDTDIEDPMPASRRNPPPEDDSEMSDMDGREFDDAETGGMDNDDGGDGSDNPPDVVCMDVPLTIRLLEYAREEASGDADLHKVAANLVSLGAQLDEVLTMDHYDEVLDGVEGGDTVDTGDQPGGGDWADYDTDSEGGEDMVYHSPDSNVDTDIDSDTDSDNNPPPRRTEMYRGPMREGKAMTFAEFLSDLPETGTTTVPTLKDTFAKRKKIPVVHTRHEVVQKGDNNGPFVIANNTTDKA
jgi:hypothetical protein